MPAGGVGFALRYLLSKNATMKKNGLMASLTCEFEAHRHAVSVAPCVTTVERLFKKSHRGSRSRKAREDDGHG
jgi:hypothetical protein